MATFLAVEGTPDVVSFCVPVQVKICEQLDSALLTDDEMAMYTNKWASLPDPAHAGFKQEA